MLHPHEMSRRIPLAWSWEHGGPSCNIIREADPANVCAGVVVVCALFAAVLSESDQGTPQRMIITSTLEESEMKCSYYTHHARAPMTAAQILERLRSFHCLQKQATQSGCGITPQNLGSSLYTHESPVPVRGTNLPFPEKPQESESS